MLRVIYRAFIADDSCVSSPLWVSYHSFNTCTTVFIVKKVCTQFQLYTHPASQVHVSLPVLHLVLPILANLMDCQNWGKYLECIKIAKKKKTAKLLDKVAIFNNFVYQKLPKFLHKKQQLQLHRNHNMWEREGMFLLAR